MLIRIGKSECGKAVGCPASEYTDHAGYRAPIALAKAVSDWVEEIHSFAFSVLAGTAIDSKGGLRANFGPSHILVYDMAAASVTSECEDPASAFRSVRVTVVHRDNAREVIGAGTWEALHADHRARVKCHCHLREDPSFLGWVPGVCRIVETGLATFYNAPVLRLHCGETGALPHWVCEILQDVTTMSTDAINNGIFLRASKRICLTCQPHPDVGSVVRPRRRLKWEVRANWD
ncbi:hypothetical protein BC628DRAFT_547856 [Trametes gibbosa]|nr:hypothetical protein BC628DRAFT_547856 [Trametes gibbosa]